MSMIAETLKVTTVQTSLFWEDVAKNLAHFSALVKDVEGTDIIILPEMFTTGFSMQAEDLAKQNAGVVSDWLKQLAAEKKAVVMGSTITEDAGKYYNRLHVALPDGQLLHYNKRHLFSLSDEHKHYTGGTEKLIFEYKGWKICPLVCYDLRFPVWSRNRKTEAGYDYDLLIYVANWPERRNHAWKSLLPARAIENQAYVAGVNRIGDDGGNIHHSGDTAVYDFKGELLSTTKPEEEKVETVELNRHDLDAFRRAYAFVADGDNFEIKS